MNPFQFSLPIPLSPWIPFEFYLPKISHYLTFSYSYLLLSSIFKNDNNAGENVSVGMIHGQSLPVAFPYSGTYCSLLHGVSLWLEVRDPTPASSCSCSEPVSSLLWRAMVPDVVM